MNGSDESCRVIRGGGGCSWKAGSGKQAGKRAQQDRRLGKGQIGRVERSGRGGEKKGGGLNGKREADPRRERGKHGAS